MDISDLKPVVLLMIFVGILVGTGLLILANFSDASRDIITATNENHSFLTSGTALTQTEVYEITSIGSTGNGTLTEGSDWNATIGTSSTTVYIDVAYNNTQQNATYEYYTDSTATTALDNVVTAVTEIPNTWISLIVTIMALAIVLGLVIKVFNTGR